MPPRVQRHERRNSEGDVSEPDRPAFRQAERDGERQRERSDDGREERIEGQLAHRGPGIGNRHKKHKNAQKKPTEFRFFMSFCVFCGKWVDDFRLLFGWRLAADGRTCSIETLGRNFLIPCS